VAPTFSQLQAFVTVARCGSVKAAAIEIKVSEAAISQAIASLRREFDDALYFREGRGVSLTYRGRQLVSMAEEILGIAESARRLGHEAQGAERQLRVVTTGTVSEYVMSALIDAFVRRQPNLEIQVAVDDAATFRDLLRMRRADVSIGPDQIRDFGIDSSPFLRYELVVVASPNNPAAGARQMSALVGQQWLLGPEDTEPSSELGRVLDNGGIGLGDVRLFPSHAAAAIAVAAGSGVTLAVAHTINNQLQTGSLARLDVAGTPVKGIWYASSLIGNPPPAALALRRFMTTPEATHATLGGGGVPPGRLHPPVHVTLWSSISRRGQAKKG
jgi:LysR family transcriptional regulator, low CO2-responsive transcriptional regulator